MKLTWAAAIILLMMTTILMFKAWVVFESNQALARVKNSLTAMNNIAIKQLYQALPVLAQSLEHALVAAALFSVDGRDWFLRSSSIASGTAVNMEE